MKKDEINKLDGELVDELVLTLKSVWDLAVVKAPPGSGKTYTLIEVVSKLVNQGFSIALAAQTNKQADDIAKRCHKYHPKIQVIRLGGSQSQPPRDFPASIPWVTQAKTLPRTPGIYISTSSKWSTLDDAESFDLLAVDEAWQMSWANLMKCARLSKKFFLIGDPGQIPPVVTIEHSRWKTSPRGPHLPAPEVVLNDPELRNRAFMGSLSACRRLPNESVRFIRHFYDFEFFAYAEMGERKISYTGLSTTLEKLKSGEPLAYTIKTPDEGALIEVDNRISKSIKQIVKEILEANATIISKDDSEPEKLEAKHIGIIATHRAMNGDISQELGEEYNQVMVDTPERWQGLERPIMIVVHPLSNVTDPSDFDLETGRLCVMTSRHQTGLIIVTRDHVGRTLEGFIPAASQAPGLPDSVGRGLQAHRLFWGELANSNRIIQLA